MTDSEDETNLAMIPGTTESDIIVTLYKNPDRGFQPAEIADTLDISINTAAKRLTQLLEKGDVDKTEGQYHALDREDIRRYVASHDQLIRMFEQFEKNPKGDGTINDIDEEKIESELERLEASLDQE